MNGRVLKKKEKQRTKKGMYSFLTIALIIYALVVLGFIIAMFVIEQNIYTQSLRAADASVDLNNEVQELKQDVKKLYEWIIAHI